MFGRGWTTSYELRLAVHADGSVGIVDYHSGLTVVYRRLGQDVASDTAIAIDRMARAAREVGLLQSDRERHRYIARLRGSASFRRAEWARMVRDGLHSAPTLPVGIRLYAECNRQQYVAVVGEGFQRFTHQAGRAGPMLRVHGFDHRGRLTRVQSFERAPSSNATVEPATERVESLELAYDPQGRLVHVQDANKSALRFSYGDRGLVTVAEATRPAPPVAPPPDSVGDGPAQPPRPAREVVAAARFQYDRDGRLVWARTDDKDVSAYRYDPDHNLIAIGHAEREGVQIGYESITQNARSLVTPHDVAAFMYGRRKTGEYDVLIGVRLIHLRGADRRRGRLQRLEQSRLPDPRDGSWYLYRAIETQGLLAKQRITDSWTDTVYDRCGRVVRRLEAGTLYVRDDRFDSRGRLVEHTDYNPARPTARHVGKFEYGESGRVRSADDGSGDPPVELDWDASGRLSSIVRGETRYELTRDPEGRVVEVTHSEHGALRFETDVEGRLVAMPEEGREDAASELLSGLRPILRLLQLVAIRL